MVIWPPVVQLSVLFFSLFDISWCVFFLYFASPFVAFATGFYIIHSMGTHNLHFEWLKPIFLGIKTFMSHGLGSKGWDIWDILG